MTPVNAAPCVEVWRSTQAVRRGQHASVKHTSDGETLFAVIEEPLASNFEDQVRVAYEALLATANKTGYRHFLRIWNYFPDIHTAEGDLDRYKLFCRGRHAALTRVLGEFDALLPAASAVGTHGGGLLIFALASQTAGRPRENPRQTPAYHYPPEYGPRSPSFARATLLPGGQRLYISGTASIVGHASCHPGDLDAQTDETLRNLSELITSTDADEGTAFGGLKRIRHAKVYLRSPGDLGRVQARIANAFADDCQIRYLQAEICRSELLIEIEAIAVSS
jgi:chorismate lyase/3-hydroxybenzoate synthase